MCIRRQEKKTGTGVLHTYTYTLYLFQLCNVIAQGRMEDFEKKKINVEKFAHECFFSWIRKREIEKKMSSE